MAIKTKKCHILYKLKFKKRSNVPKRGHLTVTIFTKTLLAILKTSTKALCFVSSLVDVCK